MVKSAVIGKTNELSLAIFYNTEDKKKAGKE